MSSRLRDTGNSEGTAPTDGAEEVPARVTHPRGAGFRVLSRIARTQADDDYAPRHRRDVPAELDLRVAIAG